MEYKIIRGNARNCEERLNKLSKNNSINIIQMCAIREDLIILMTVTPKVQFPE